MRVIGCHATCEKYKAFRDDLDATNEDYRRYKKGLSDFELAVHEAYLKNKKKRRRW